MSDQTPEARRAAALEALRIERPAAPPAASFWQEHGGKVILVTGLTLGIWLLARGVGSYMQSSSAETEKAQETIRKGLR
jgi:hypothetical protein